jgi:molybdopterin adenylyltransferase
LVVEARHVADRLTKEGSNTNDEGVDLIVKALDAMGYDEAAQHIYGMDYPEWKKLHASKASEEQMDKFNASEPIWANHNKQLLTKRVDITDAVASASLVTSTPNNNNKLSSALPASPLLSNVCCQPMDDHSALLSTDPPPAPKDEQSQKSRTRQLPPYRGPDLPTNLPSFSLGILTVSDRASAGEYTTGDLSGPAVEKAVIERLRANSHGHNQDSVTLVRTEKAIVPDDVDAIVSKLKEWSDEESDDKMDLILTTGGTGFSPRDVTPEATKMVVNQPCPGLVTFCIMESAKMEPLASLSRGTAGIRGTTLIANLPGSPKGVEEFVPILLPLALHAVADLKKVESNTV